MFWIIYEYVAVFAIVSQLFFLLNTFQNYFYVLKKSSRSPNSYRPRVLVTVPCKGIDKALAKNISSLFAIDYDGFYLQFVVECKSDPVYEELCRLKDKLSGTSKALDVRILVAGLADGCSQKVHNLLFSCNNSPEDVEVFAFVDSDACIRPDWLSHLVHPLRKDKHGASTGYRWFVPQRNNLATFVLSSLNAKVAQMLGNSPFVQAWGGSMAIKKKLFYDIGLDEIWKNALSDDLCLSWAVKRRAKKKIVFVPACFVASYEETTWPEMFEFVRRQFLITRVILPGTWLFALYCSFFGVLGLWLGLGIAIYAWVISKSGLLLYAALPIIFYVCQIIRPILRQKMILRLLSEDKDKIAPAMYADILGNVIWSLVLLVCIVASAFGRTIVWRGIEYKLIGPTETHIKKR